MNKLLDLGQRKDALVKASEAIHAAAQTANRPFTTEERVAINGNLDEIQAINDTVTLEQRLAAASNIPGDHSPATVRANALDKPFGPEPRSSETPYQRKSRLAVGFGEQLMAIRTAALKPGMEDPRLKEIERRSSPAGASEAVPADGGFLIAPDYSDEIMVIAHDTGLVYTRGRKLPLSNATNAIKVPGIDEQSRADGSRWGGVRMYWQNEADSLIGSKPKYRLIELVSKKLTGLYYATDEVIADSALLGSTVTQAFGEEVGFKMDDAAINGDGSGKPLGIMNANALITIAKETGQASATLLFQNVTKMWYRLYSRSRKNAVWFVNQDVEQQLLQMSLPVGTGGSSVVAGVAPAGPGVYVPPGAMGNDTGLLFGRPVIAIEQCQTLGTTGDIILADMSQWIYVDKGDMQQATSMHVRFLTDEMTFRWIYRVDGQPQWHTALTPFKGTNTQSPFVALAAR